MAGPSTLMNRNAFIDVTTRSRCNSRICNGDRGLERAVADPHVRRGLRQRTLIQLLHWPDLYGGVSRFKTIPSSFSPD